jgi:hypothetical protein
VQNWDSKQSAEFSTEQQAFPRLGRGFSMPEEKVSCSFLGHEACRKPKKEGLRTISCFLEKEKEEWSLSLQSCLVMLARQCSAEMVPHKRCDYPICYKSAFVRQ